MKHFVITIARGYGSGGKTIGKHLAEALGVPCYDRELLRLASEDSGIHERLFGRADENLPNFFKSLKTKFKKSKVYSGEVLPPESDEFVSDDNLFNLQAKLIRELAEKESCVIVGRCADFVLKDNKDVVRLYVYAPFETCIKNVMDMYGVTKRQAEKQIISTDKHRSEYYHYYTGKDWNLASNYDLCLNTEQFTFDQCVDIVKAYLEIRG